MKARIPVIAVLASALLLPLPGRSSPPPQVSQVVEIDGDPLRIQVFANGRLQVFHRNYVNGAAYGDGASGAFIAIGSDVYGPRVPIGPDSVEYETLGNQGPIGRGSEGDPYRLVTTQRLVGPGAELGLVQTVSYVDGQNRFQLTWEITNAGSQQSCFRFYHAADLYFADSDYGFGFYDSASGAVGGFNERRDWYMVFIPTTPADHYQESHFGDIWQTIDGAEDFSDTISDQNEDNGAALQWDVCLSPGDTTTLGDLWSFGTSEGEAISSAGGGFRPTGPLASELTTFIPTPLDVSLDPGVIGANLLLAALAMIAFVASSGALTKILTENQEEAKRFFLVRWVSGLQRAIHSVFGARLSRLSITGLIKLVGIVLFYGLVFSLLDRTWTPFSLAGLWLFVSMTIAYGLVGIAADIVQWFAARRWGLPAELSLRPTSVLLAIVSTAASRIFGLLPGLMFGTPEAFDVGPQAPDRKRERRLLMVAAGTLLAIGACSWLPTLVTALIQRMRVSDPILALVGGVESLLLVVFAVTVENGFVQMLPLPGNVGDALKRWNRWLWILALSAVVFIFFHLLMNPAGDLAAALREANVLFFVLTVIGFSVGVVLLWLYFRWRSRRRLAAAPAAAAPVTPGEVAIAGTAKEAAVGPAGMALAAAVPGEAQAVVPSPAPAPEPGTQAAPLAPVIEPAVGSGIRPAEVGPHRVAAVARRRPQRKGSRLSPLAFGLIGLAAVLLIALVGAAFLIGILIVALR